ncbi:hypothetical protein OH809_30085 [Streptomyces sp. NBC_00873]|uniref:hypothetical protein n=1 Tax=Streptomyces sp. NBC_00873 TaxID=2975852 RepID=UPI00386D9272|nr:hypothetical protein OH809_30085 [Streptomyces sp. NBC_00873]
MKLQATMANSNTVDYTYFLDGALKTTSEKKPNGTLVSSRTYAYNPNGNKAQDVAKKMNADNQAAYLDSTADFTYDPADRLAESVKTGNGAATEAYVHDDNANVISQTVSTGLGSRRRPVVETSSEAHSAWRRSPAFRAAASGPVSRTNAFTLGRRTARASARGCSRRAARPGPPAR